MKFFDETVV